MKLVNDNGVFKKLRIDMVSETEGEIVEHYRLSPHKSTLTSIIILNMTRHPKNSQDTQARKALNITILLVEARNTELEKDALEDLTAPEFSELTVALLQKSF